MAELYLSKLSTQDLYYLNGTPKFMDFDGSLYLYKLTVDYYENLDVDVTIRDHLGSKIPINIQDVPEFITAFTNVLTASTFCKSFIKDTTKKDC